LLWSEKNKPFQVSVSFKPPEQIIPVGIDQEGEKDIPVTLLSDEKKRVHVTKTGNLRLYRQNISKIENDDHPIERDQQNV
jgi:hypothetical protein